MAPSFDQCTFKPNTMAPTYCNVPHQAGPVALCRCTIIDDSGRLEFLDVSFILLPVVYSPFSISLITKYAAG